MADAKIGFDDIFDFSSDAEIKKGTEAVNELTKALLDLSDKGIKRVRDEAKDLNDISEQVAKSNKKTADSYDELNKQTARLENEYDQIVDSQKQISQSNDKLKGSVEGLQKEYKDQLAALKKINTETAEGKKAYQEQEKVVVKLKTEVSTFNKELNRQVREAQQANDIYSKTSLELRKMKREYKSMITEFKDGVPVFGKNEREAEKLKKKIEQLDTGLKDFDKSLGENFRNIGNYESAFEALSGAGGQAGQIIGQFGGALGAAAGPLAAVVGAIALGVKGFMELNALAKEILPKLQAVQSRLGLMGDDLFRITAGIQATADLWEQDFNEVLRSTNVLMEEFEMTGDEALSAIQAGFITGVNASDEMLDSIREYSVQFKAAGVDAGTMFSIMREAEDRGIFSDKALDTVKEAGLSLREMTKTTKDALIPLGKLRNEQILQAVESGNTFKAMQLVSKGLSEVSLTAAETQTIIADVFKGAGEDAGLDFILGLQNVSSEMITLQDIIDDTSGKFTNYQKQQAANVLATQEFEKSQALLAASFGTVGEKLDNFWQGIKTQFNTFLSNTITGFRRFVGWAGALFDSVKKLAEGDLNFIQNVKDGIAKADKELMDDILFQKEQAEKKEEDVQLAVRNTSKAVRDQANEWSKLFKLTRKGLPEINTGLTNLQKTMLKITDLVFGPSKIKEQVDNYIKGVSARIEATKMEVNEEAALRQKLLEQNVARARKWKDTKKELVKETEQAALDAITTGFELQRQAADRAYQADLAALESQYQAELEAAGDNEEAKVAIQEEFDAQRARLEAEAAQRDKRIALAEIAVNTAVSVAKTLAAWGIPFGLPFAAIAIAQGALQAALVSGISIPGFFEGTKDSPEGPIAVGERGRELVVTPQGDLMMTPSKTTVTEKIPAHSTIIPNRDTEQILAAAAEERVASDSVTGASEFAALGEDIRADRNRIYEAIADQTQYITNVNERGVEKLMKTKSGTVKYLDKRFK